MLLFTLLKTNNKAFAIKKRFVSNNSSTFLIDCTYITIPFYKRILNYQIK